MKENEAEQGLWLARTPPLARPYAVVLGSRADGRSYGILRISGGERPTGALAARLVDFALSLPDWSLHGAAPFAMFAPLEGAGCYVLARCAYLGQGELGVIGQANALIVDADVWAAYGSNIASLAALIPCPSAGAWNPAEFEWPIAVDVPGLAARADIAELGRLLRYADRPLLVGVSDTLDTIDAVREILETASLLTAQPISWITTALLRRNGKFDPTQLDLIAAASPDAQPDVQIDKTQVAYLGVNGFAAASVWRALFESAGQSSQLLAEISWHPRFRGMPIADLISEAVGSALSTSDVTIDDGILALQNLAKAVGQLLPAQREAAVQGIIAAVERFATARDGEAFAHAISRYLSDVAPLMPDAPPILAPRIVATHGRLAAFCAPELRNLFEAGLGTTFAHLAEPKLAAAGLALDQRIAVIDGVGEASGLGLTRAAHARIERLLPKPSYRMIASLFGNERLENDPSGERALWAAFYLASRAFQQAETRHRDSRR